MDNLKIIGIIAVIAYLIIEILFPYLMWYIDKRFFNDLCSVCKSSTHIWGGKQYCNNKNCERHSNRKTLED